MTEKPQEIHDKKKDFLVFGAPDIQNDEVEAVLAVMRSGWLGTGPRVKEFEARFEEYKGAGHAVALNSCTAALHLALLALDLSPGDEVITTPLTFCATVNTILHAGATPVLVDVDEKTLNIDPDLIQEAVTPKTKAILPVHFAGNPCDMKRILELAEDHKLRVVEDCAHAIEANIGSQHAGTFGDVGCFSFYATKNVVTGEGGMALAADQGVADRIRTLSLHGMSHDAWKRFGSSGYRHYDVVAAGYKYNMMDLQAAIGLPQLQRVEEALHRRQEAWADYCRRLQGTAVRLPPEAAPGARHARHLFTIRLEEEHPPRDEFVQAMTAQGIGVGVHYRSVPSHSFYQKELGWDPEDWPVAHEVGKSIVSLPMGSNLGAERRDSVVAAVKNALATHSGSSVPR